MPINRFNGQAIFGIAVKMSGTMNPRAVQYNAYAATSGMESLDLGGRGRVTKVSGILNESTRNDLSTAMLLMQSYVDGRPYAFYDSSGIGWRNVLMNPPEFGQIRGASAGGYFVDYTVVLNHLTSS